MKKITTPKKEYVSEQDAKQLFRKLRLYEYLLILSPNEILWEKIMELKREFSEKYSCPSAQWFKPHITLCKFVQVETIQPQICRRLTSVARELSHFKIELDGFGSFPTHTIYLAVKTQEPVKTIIKKTKVIQRLMAFNSDNKPYFTIEAHLTIARGLLPWQYEKSWVEFSNKSFTGAFLADHFVLLRRLVGDKKYEVAGKFDFENLSMEVKQGDLFG